MPYLVLLLLGFAVYGDSPGHDFLRNWNDPAYVTHNPAIRGVTPGNILTPTTLLHAGNIAPLQMLSYLPDHDRCAGGGVRTSLKRISPFMVVAATAAVSLFSEEAATAYATFLWEAPLPGSAVSGEDRA